MARCLPVDRHTRPTGPVAGFSKAETDQTIGRRFGGVVAACADRLAVKADGREATYADLDRASGRIACGIREASTDSAPSVAVLCDTGIAGIAAMLGALRSGKAFVPLDPSYPAARLDFMLADSLADVILADSTTLALARSLAGSRQHVLSIQALRESAGDGICDEVASPDDPACILYTSGSTGEPKGILHSHRTALHYCMKYTNALRISADDRLTMLFSFSFGVGMNNILSALLNGASLFPWAFARERVSGLAELMAREGISIYHSVPSAFRHFVAVLRGGREFGRLRLVNLSGEPVHRRDVELFREHFPSHCVMVNSMGATEINLASQYFVDRETEVHDGIVPVGYAAEDTTIRVVDDNGSEVDSGEVGEIVVTSKYLSRGYWRRPALTERCFLPACSGGEEWAYRTRDLGRMLPDGCLVHLGRMDLQVKIGGHRVEVEEIEMALQSLDAVAEAAVAARADASGARRLVAYVVPAGDEPPAAAELRRLLAETLPVHMVPSAFVFMKGLPRTATGKVQREDLPEPGRSRLGLKTPYAPPGTPVEQAVADIWAEVLGLDQVGVHDGFLDSGGDSLLAAQVSARLAATFPIELSIDSVFRRSTIADLAEMVQEQLDAEGPPERDAPAGRPGSRQMAWPSLLAVQTQGRQPPLFMVSFGLAWEVGDLSRHLGPDYPVYGLRPSPLSTGRDDSVSVESLAADHIAQIRSARPVGPYVLAGGCAAGVVAFEMARQLRAQGAEVPLLVLFDVDYPLPRYVPALLRRLIVSGPRVRRRLLRLGPREQQTYVRQLLSTWRRQLVDWLTRGELGRARPLIAQGSTEDAQWHLERLAAPGQRAVRRYVPEPYLGRIALFVSADAGVRPAPDRRFAWRSVARAECTLHVVPGDHHHVLEEPHAPFVARSLKACMADALRDAGARD